MTMDLPDYAFVLRRALTDVREVCQTLGFSLAARANERRAHILCPWHSERTPSCSVYLGLDGTIAVKCHGCGTSGDALSLIAAAHGLHATQDFGELLRIGATLARLTALPSGSDRHLPGRPRQPGAPAHRAPKKAPPISADRYDAICRMLIEHAPLRRQGPVADYMHSRCIFADAQAVDIGALPASSGDQRALLRLLIAAFGGSDLRLAGLLDTRGGIPWSQHVVLIPWFDEQGRVTSLQRRALGCAGQPKYVFPSGLAPKAPFGIDVLIDALEYMGADAEVIIVEGALDALARRRIARQRGERAAVLGVPSASSPTVGLPLALLAGRRVVLALDDDEAGDRACERLSAALQGVATALVRERPVGFTDWNAALVASEP